LASPSASGPTLASQISHYISLNLHAPAIHLATLHSSLNPSPAASLLLARAHLLRGDNLQALHSLSPHKTVPDCIYLYGLCLHNLKNHAVARLHFQSHLENVPPLYQAAASFVMAETLLALQDRERAIAHYKNALQADPYLTESLTRLCELGVPVDVPKVFNVSPPELDEINSVKASNERELADAGGNGGNGGTGDNSDNSDRMELNDLSLPDVTAPTPPTHRTPFDPRSGPGSGPFDPRSGPTSFSPNAHPQSRVLYNTLTSHASQSKANNSNNRSNFQSSFLSHNTSTRSGLPATSLFGTPVFAETPDLTPIIKQPDNMQTLRKSHRNHTNANSAATGNRLNFDSFDVSTASLANSLTLSATGISNINASINNNSMNNMNSVNNEGGVLGAITSPDSTPINNNIRSSPNTRRKQASAEKKIPKMDNFMGEAALPPPAPAQIYGNAVQHEAGPALSAINSTLCVLFTGLQLHSLSNAQLAITAFNVLPRPYVNTSYVQRLIAQCYFTLADYSNARLYFAKGYALNQNDLTSLSMYSTTLWHLKQEVTLSYLAQKVVEVDVNSPECWCIVGNTFSLQKEHEVALKFFHRAIQIDPQFTYAHTLAGHEYVCLEDFERAVGCFRNAIRCDHRHYNAWYGLGSIYYRQEKFSLAQYHFRQAIAINPQSSILYCHLGMVLHATKKYGTALEVLDYAMVLDIDNPQARFQRAAVLISLERHGEALDELIKVRDHAPREAAVHFLIGKVYKKLGNTEAAMRSFVTALDLDPKDNNAIKGAIERLDEVDVEEDVSGF
jgi:anaphase-promoting complex subunit 3